MTSIAAFVLVLVPALSNSPLLVSAQGPGADSYVVQAIPPFYPPLALAANVSGEVAVEATINWKGDVVSLRTIEGHKLLSMAAEKAASRWRFVPLIEGSKDRTVRLYFKFTMVPRNGTPDDVVTIFWPPHKVEVRDVPGRLSK